MIWIIKKVFIKSLEYILCICYKKHGKVFSELSVQVVVKGSISHKIQHFLFYSTMSAPSLSISLGSCTTYLSITTSMSPYFPLLSSWTGMFQICVIFNRCSQNGIQPFASCSVLFWTDIWSVKFTPLENVKT